MPRGFHFARYGSDGSFSAGIDTAMETLADNHNDILTGERWGGEMQRDLI